MLILRSRLDTISLLLATVNGTLHEVMNMVSK